MQLFNGSAEAGPALPEAVQPAAPDSQRHIRQPASLFASDYQYALIALRQLSQGQAIAQWNHDDVSERITLTAPRDLVDRLRQLPREAQSDNDEYTLSARREEVAHAIETARQARAEEDTWPRLHYLWPQHPIMDWLADRVLTAFGRHKAPVLRSSKLAAGEHAFILMALIPNRKGQPLLVEWQAAVALPPSPASGRGAGGEGIETTFRLEPLDLFIARAGLKAESLANRGAGAPLAELQAALPQAVQTMQTFMQGRQLEFDASMSKKLAGTLADLERLQGKQMQQLEIKLEQSGQAEPFKRSRFEQRSQQIHRVFDDYRQWVEDSMNTEPQAHIQVLAAVHG